MLDTRSNAAELMDTDTVDAADYRACLRDLATVNRLFRAARPTLDFLDRAVADRLIADRLRVCDVAFGQGDMLARVWAWARRRGRAVELFGVDLNPDAAAAAHAAHPACR